MAAWAAIAAEWFVGAWLLTGFARIRARRAALTLLATFIGVAGWRLFASKADCGCFGYLHVRPAMTLVFDFVALAAVYLLGRAVFDRGRIDGASGRANPPSAPSTIWAVGVSLLIPAAAFGVSHFVSARVVPEPVVLVNPQSCLSKPFPLLDLVDGPARADLTNGRRTVILFNRQCDTCTEYLTRLALTAGSGSEVAGIRVMDIAPAESGDPDRFTPRFPEIRLRQGVFYAVNVPLKITLRNGIVEGMRPTD